MDARGEGGRFLPKGEVARKVRSIRLTDKTWNRLNEAADVEGVSTADYIERMFESAVIRRGSQGNSSQICFGVDDFEIIVNTLEIALSLKANAGGAIKDKIREVLNLLQT